MNKPKIITIDDQPENLQMIVQILKDDYSVIASTSAQKAFDLVEKHKDAALILLDVFMPEMNGFEVLEQLKSAENAVDIPVIFVTGIENEQDYEKGLALGAFDFVQKPISPLLLKNRIKNCLSSVK